MAFGPPCVLLQGRSSALPHMSHRLFEMVGKPVGKPPAPYKPRGPRSPAGLVAAAAGTPGSGPPPPAVAPQAPAAPAATAARQPPQTAPRPVAATAAPAAAGEQGGPGGPAHTAAARAAATAAGDVAPLSGGPDPREAMAQLAAQYPAELIRIAALVRRTLGMQRGSVVHLRMMLKTLHLANQEVRFQSKAGKVLNYGKLSDTGGILCFCKNCHGKVSGRASWASLGSAHWHEGRAPHAKGARPGVCLASSAGMIAALLLPVVPSVLQEVSASEFEEHSGSKDRRPADGIFLQSECMAACQPCHPVHLSQQATVACGTLTSCLCRVRPLCALHAALHSKASRPVHPGCRPGCVARASLLLCDLCVRIPVATKLAT